MWGKSTFHFEISESSQTSGQSTSKNVYVIVSKVNQIQHTTRDFEPIMQRPHDMGPPSKTSFFSLMKLPFLRNFADWRDRAASATQEQRRQHRQRGADFELCRGVGPTATKAGCRRNYNHRKTTDSRGDADQKCRRKNSDRCGQLLIEKGWGRIIHSGMGGFTLPVMGGK